MQAVSLFIQYPAGLLLKQEYIYRVVRMVRILPACPQQGAANLLL